MRARFERDPGSIQRLYFDQQTGRRIGVICRALAAARKVYRCVEPAELDRVSGTLHHGGVVAVVAAPALREPTRAEVRRWAQEDAVVLLLDRIGNAHNLGAIARTAAFLGVAHIVIPADPAAAVPNEAAYRVAEGGLEHLTVWRTANLTVTIAALKAAQFDVVGAATRGGVATASRAAPLALVMGNEETGLAPAVAAACTRLVTVRGRGAVESLNVSVAAGILLYALWPRER